MDEPVVLTDEELDVVAGGVVFVRHVDIDVTLRNSPIQVNNSINAVSAGNNNNNGGNISIG